MSNQNSNIEETLEQLYKDYSSSDDSTHYYAKDRLFELCKKDIEPFIKLAQNTSPFKRMCAFEILGCVGGETAYLALLTGLQDKDMSVREKAILNISNFLDSRAIDPLIKALKDRNNVVRRFAASNLYKIPEAKVIEPLFRAASNDKDEWVKVHAATSLAKLEDSRAEALLEEIGQNKIYDSAVSSSARQALFELRKAKETKNQEPNKTL